MAINTKKRCFHCKTKDGEIRPVGKVKVNVKTVRLGNKNIDVCNVCYIKLKYYEH